MQSAQVETAGTSAWAMAHSQPQAWQSQNERPSQTAYPGTNWNSHSQQTNQAMMGQAKQVSYVAESNFADESNAYQTERGPLQNQSHQVTDYPSIEYSNLPQPTQPQTYPNSPAASQRAVPNYPPSRRLARTEQAPARTIVTPPAMQPAEPTLAQRPSSSVPAHSEIARESSVLEKTAQETSVLESDESFSVLQASFETRILKPDSRLSAPHLTSQIRFDKQGLTEPSVTVENEQPTELMQKPEPSAKPMLAPGAAQGSMLPRQRANPQVEVNARKRIQYGESLSRRRSFYAAREEFILALLLVSNSHGNESTNNAYSDRLAKALTALDEVGDFKSMLNRNGHDPQFQQTIRSHKTQLFAGANLTTISPRKAIDLYCGFAQSQAEQAIGFSAAGSEALHALGKLELMAPDTSSLHASSGQTKALVFFRASLNVNPSNALCANDLGILLFNMGRLNESEEALRHSLASAQSRVVWSNLASVHTQQASLATAPDQRNEQLRLAQMAETQAQKFQNNPRDNGLAGNEWATTSDFQNNAAIPDTAVQGASRNINENTQPGGAREKAVSFLQKVTGLN